ncbi:hypothetical protein [Clostridiisalibacter paucivorans]|uniref:hypothetical protein n=1 Tax=Clostridiisalibacter paucivorans TaxID=408753 RepID=UPI0005591738|nr:hypothetical protein [Clostridiisalibacter paucivorans]
MISRLKNKDGSAIITACVVVVCLLLLFTVISEYLRLQIIAKGVRDTVQSSVISLATQNYDEVYNGLREGYSGGYELDRNDRWKSKVDEGAVLSDISNVLGLRNGEKYAGSQLEYRITNLDINILNTPLAPSGNSKKFESEVWLNLQVPLSFGWDKLPPLKIRMKVNAGYTPKF